MSFIEVSYIKKQTNIAFWKNYNRVRNAYSYVSGFLNSFDWPFKKIHVCILFSSMKIGFKCPKTV